MTPPYQRTADGFELTFGTYQLQSRLESAAAAASALAAHPGIVSTGLWRTTSRWERALISPRLRLLNSRFAQSAQPGALPTLRAAADPPARGGAYYGPRGRFGAGHPALAESSARSHDAAAQRRLWEVSEQLTGVTYRLPASSATSGTSNDR